MSKLKGARTQILRSRRALVVDAVAAVLATAGALLGLAAVAASPRAMFLFFDANSLLLELVHRSLAAGGPQHWTMSAALFFFPEIPVYEAVRFFAAAPQGALLANALLYLLAVYVLLRVIAWQLWRGSRGAVAALVAFLTLCLALVYETSQGRDSFELVSDLLFAGYYNGTVVAVLGSVALVIALHRVRRAQRVVTAIGLVVLGAVATASNPLYLLWFSVPLGCSIFAVALIRRALPSLWLVVASVGGPVLGLLARVPLERFISAPSERYIHPGGAASAAEFYATQLRQLTIAGHLGELFVLLFLTGCSVVGVVLVARRRLSAEASLVVVFGALAMPLVFAINIALGTQTVRYLQPMYFAQSLSVVVVVGWALRSAALGAAAATIAPSRRKAFAAVGVALAAALTVGGGIAAVAMAESRHSPPASIDCLENWIGNRDIAGIATFWNARPAEVYGDASVQLVQVSEDVEVDPWLVNLADYRNIEVSYAVYGGLDTRGFRATLVAQLGEPSAVVDCDDFLVLDYVGASTIAGLGDRLSESARDLERERGFVD